MTANTEWISLVISLGLCVYYGYKIFVKKQKTTSHGFLLGIMLVLFILSLSKIAAKLIIN